MPSLGSNRTAVYNADGTVKEFVTTYSVYNNGVSTPFNTYQEAADYMNSIGGSAMSNSQLQAAVRESSGSVQAVFLDNKQVDLQTGQVENEVLLDQNKANETGTPSIQETGNTDGYGAQNELAAPTADVRTAPSIIGDEDAQQAAFQTFAAAGDEDAQQAPFGVFNQPSEVQVGTIQAQRQETTASQAQATFPQNRDWRVVLRLAPGANYLYKAPQAGLLQPLKVTDGVIFPYTPNISTAYKADYSAYDLTHSNYRGYFYKNSYVDQITVNATFTAQSTADAAYVLAVIHFFRSVTKMFYGQDAQRGTPPPLVFLSGLGDYQFNNHPCLVSQFNYKLPADVDYISSGTPNNLGLNLQPLQNLYSSTLNAIGPTATRLAAAFLPPGAQNALPAPLQQVLLSNPTYVPSKIDIDLILLPVQTRQQVSKQFSLKDFATGQQLKGGFW